MPKLNPVAGEIERLKQRIAIHRALVDALESCLDGRVPASEAAAAVAQSATNIVAQAAKLDVVAVVAVLVEEQKGAP